VPYAACARVGADQPDVIGFVIYGHANHFETVSASDGYSAIALAQKERPDLVILDLGLPAGDGYVVLKRMQQSNVLSDIPIIALTARDPQMNEDRSLDAGAAAT